MKSILLKISIIAGMLLPAVSTLFSQEPILNNDTERLFYEASSFYEKGMYVNARKVFEEVVDELDNNQSIMLIDARYYVAKCALLMDERDAEYILKQFSLAYPNDSRVNDLYFEMGRLQFMKKKYPKSINWFELVDKTALSFQDRMHYHFELGYSYFAKEEYEPARIAFYEIKDLAGEYYATANYYYGHIAYLTEDYQTALNAFERIASEPDFSNIVPFYLIQIYFIQGDYEKIKTLGPELMEKSSEARAVEIVRLIGEAYFHTREFEQAIPYLQAYKDHTESYSRDDIYQLAYAYYQTKDWQNAIENFEKLTRGESELTQNAYFHLADCYLQIDDKQKAGMAFGAAATMPYDEVIAEESLFNQAKLSFDMSYSPFNQTIRLFDEFLRKYPNSLYRDMAYDYLVKVFMATRNYDEALTYLEKIEEKNDPIKTAYQRAAYFRAVEYFIDNDFDRAVLTFEKSLRYGHLNPSLKSQAHYWTAEAHYRLGYYPKAIDWYQKFMNLASSVNQPEYPSAFYNTAYAHFQLKDYDQAILWFRRFLNRESKAEVLKSDATIRLADCYYKTRQFDEGIRYYDLAIKQAPEKADYASYQKAISYGLLREYDKKNWVLRQMIEQHTNSKYRVDALFQLGRSYQDLNDLNPAIAAYRQLAEEFPNSTYVTQAYNQIGLIYYNLDQSEEALEVYKWVVDSFPQSPDAITALESIERIYLENNREQEYFAWRDGLQGVSKLSINEKDSISYLTAEKFYMRSQFEQAAQAFANYIRDFADGAWIIEAHYYKADCHRRLNQDKPAFESYAFVASRSMNSFTEESLVQAARISMKWDDYPLALAYYKKLESMAGNKEYLVESRIAQMQCHYHLEQWEEAILSANVVLISDLVPDKTKSEAHFILGKSFLANDDLSSAINEFKYLESMTQSILGAEARYRIAEILFAQQKYDECEQEILDFNQTNTPHQFWLAKAIVLLSDVYLAKKDYFQARHTLESIIQFYAVPTDGIIESAQERLQIILRKEEEETLFKHELDKAAVKDSVSLELDSASDSKEGIDSNELMENPEEETTPTEGFDTLSIDSDANNLVIPPTEEEIDQPAEEELPQPPVDEETDEAIEHSGNEDETEANEEGASDE